MNTTPNDLLLLKPSQWLADKIAIALFPGGWYGSYWGNLEVLAGEEAPAKETDPWVTVEEIDVDADGRRVCATYTLTTLDLIRGLELMIQSKGEGARRHAGWGLTENGDATTQDLLVQYACFGEARYD